MSTLTKCLVENCSTIYNDVWFPLRPPKRSIGDDLRASGGKLTKMGSAELTRLWNLEKDNMAACRSQERCVH